jgi:hypothetical protein
MSVSGCSRLVRSSRAPHAVAVWFRKPNKLPLPLLLLLEAAEAALQEARRLPLKPVLLLAP